MASEREKEVFEIDRFLAEPKTLIGPLPRWGKSKFFGKTEPEMEAKWPIADSLGIVGRGQLRFALRLERRQCPSVPVIYGGKSVLRLDLEEPHVCEPNPHWAQYLIDIPAQVCGSHIHTWAGNRQFILDQEVWEIPCRLPLNSRIKKLDQAVPWLASQINISLEPDQHGFSLPGSLF